MAKKKKLPEVFVAVPRASADSDTPPRSRLAACALFVQLPIAGSVAYKVALWSGVWGR